MGSDDDGERERRYRKDKDLKRSQFLMFYVFNIKK